jgi:hydroxymethylbilane synthase
VIHSYKDLGSERPQGIKLAAITQRSFAHDVLLIKKSTIEKLKDWRGDFIVGTSSPRRIENLTSSLSDFLPSHPSIRCETLRGNINTRIQKLRDDHYHAITLALAGVERLAHHPDSLVQLQELLKDLSFMILPQSVFPSAASQGALGIEVAQERSDQGVLERHLKTIHHAPTAEEVRREREAFKSYGGGCHLAVGIHVRQMAESFLHFHRGAVDGKKIMVKRRESGTPPVGVINKVFLGMGESSSPQVIPDKFFIKTPHHQAAPLKGKHAFATSRLVLGKCARDTSKLVGGRSRNQKKISGPGLLGAWLRR